MAANKTGSKSGKASTPKKKASARQHAAERVSAQGGGGGRAAAVPRSIKQISQGRFPGETPLTGEDRPASGPSGKQRGFRQDMQPTRSRGQVGRDTGKTLGAPPTKRRRGDTASTTTGEEHD